MRPERAGEQAVLLSLAAEDAIKREDWEELAILLRQRATEIHRLVDQNISVSKQDHEFLLQWQNRVLSQLARDKQRVVREVSNLQKAKRAQLAYAAAGPFDASRRTA